MGYAVLLVVMCAVALLLASSRGMGQGPSAEGEKPQVTDTADTASAKRSEVRDRLLKLAREEPPKNLSMGAMCYEMAGPPQRVDYVCPKCGEKTLYALVESGDDVRLYQDTGFLQWDLPACRRVAEQIEGIKVELDETQFCAHCSPGTETPKLVLAVYYEGEDKPHKVEGVTLDDLRLLAEFFAGEDKHAGAQGQETPLKNHTTRLSELLGVELSTEN